MKHNFYAGPAILSKKVLTKASEAAINFNNSGLSILEISHRSKDFVEVMEKAEALVCELLQISDDYKVLFLTGGASSQFYMTAMNLLNKNEKAGYVDTGAWSAKAIKEANLFGKAEVTASSKDKNYSYIPKDYSVDPDYKYLHITSNNTIFGTQYASFPDIDVPMIGDMSSDIFSRSFDHRKFDVIYAGAQKNLGPAGVSLVIVKKNILGRVQREIPSMLNYQTHIDKNSSFNTPPVFPIYVSMLSLEWLKDFGGIPAIAQRNEEKANLIYKAIDDSPLFECPVSKEDRSKMNVVFMPTKEGIDDAFLKMAESANCIGIIGHRSVGGYRASIYNAMPTESVKVLADVINEFSQIHG